MIITKEVYCVKKWTQEEIDYLTEKWGTVKINSIATKLNRSEKAIILKAKKLKLGGCYQASGKLSANQVAKILNIDPHTITDYWISKCKLKATKKVLMQQECYFIDLETLMKWLKTNEDKWDSRRVEIYALGTEPKWLKEKRKKDQDMPERRFHKWTKKEDDMLISYINVGKKHREIAEIINRSKDSVTRRVSRLKAQKLLYKNAYVPWTEKEDKMLLKMDTQGKLDSEIAWELGRDLEHIRDHRRTLKIKGEYPCQSKAELIAEEHLKEIIKLKNQGFNNKEIAKKLNIHQCTVYRRIKKAKEIECNIEMQH